MADPERKSDLPHPSSQGSFCLFLSQPKPSTPSSASLPASSHEGLSVERVRPGDTLPLLAGNMKGRLPLQPSRVERGPDQPFIPPPKPSKGGKTRPNIFHRRRPGRWGCWASPPARALSSKRGSSQLKYAMLQSPLEKRKGNSGPRAKIVLNGSNSKKPRI